jgi:ATP/maltotriose-dependent transcriptional regulator MalT
MVRVLFAAGLLSVGLAAQGPLPENAGRLLEQGHTAEAERLLRRWSPKPDQQSESDLLWALVGRSYLGANDYAAAERVTAERMRGKEQPLFLFLMAEVERLQGKYAAAFPLYQRLYQLWLDNRLPADFQAASEYGYVECLLVRGDGQTAEQVAQPAVNPDGSAVGPSFHEAMFNTYAVAMEEAGHRPAAVQVEEMIDKGSRRPAAANQQDRDLLRARILSARLQDAAAEAIYKRWTTYWKTAAMPAGMDPKEWLQIRTVALEGYSHFLSRHQRARDVQAVQAELTAMGCRFGLCN